MTLPGFFGSLATAKKKVQRQEDFWQFAERYERLLYKAAFQYTGNRFDAEDLVQETFLAAHRNIHQLKDRRKIKPWLFVILRNNYLKGLRRGRSGPEQEYDDRIDYIDALQVLAAREDALHTLERKATAENVHQWLSKLPETYQSVLILYYLKEFSYQEIADILEIPPGTVMSRLSRGKQRLKTAIMKDTFQARFHKKVIPMARKG
ncbi:MAG: sigma-70 family RNA polymerase sigma factor [Desulfosarcina sp.]|nr:sigma-70 family RNA polymerase sigma factor [Desulfobacterales bacterium]